MPEQATQLYNSGYDVLITDALAGTGEFMWVLVDTDYIPDPAHTTGADLGTDAIITPDDLQPINATSVAITTIGTGGYFQTDNVSIGPYTSGADSYRYLVLVRPITPGTYADTAELIFYIDLIGSSSNDTTAAGESVVVNMTSSGWFKMVQ